MHGRLRLITPPALEPVTLAEAKLHARIDHDLEDGLLATFIAAARQHGEQLTGRQFVEAAYELSLDGFPCDDGPIELPKPPLQAVEAVSFVAPDGITQTMSATDYVVDTSGLLGRIYPADGAAWPAARRRRNAVTISFRTGWPVVTGNPSTPDAIKSWMLCRIAGLYEQRESFAGRSVSALPGDFLDGLLDPWRVAGVV